MPNFTPDPPAAGAAEATVQAGIATTQAGIATTQAGIATTAAGNAQASAFTCATWVALAAITGTAAGQGAEVLDADAGTHTDPVVGGTVANAGRYTWSASPAGWKRIGSTGLAAKADATVVAAQGVTLADLGTALGTAAPAGDFPFGWGLFTAPPGTPGAKMAAVLDPDGKLAMLGLRIFAPVATGDLSGGFAIIGPDGKAALVIDPRGRILAERANERTVTLSGDVVPYLQAVLDRHGRQGSLVTNPDGTVEFLPGAETAGRIASQMAAGLTLAEISASVLPGNIGALTRAGVDLWRVWSDTTGVNRPYLGRGRKPKAWLPEGREAVLIVPKTCESTGEGAWASPIRQSAPPAPNSAIMLGALRGYGDRVFQPGMVRGLAPALDAVETNGSVTLGSTGLATCGAMIEALSPANARRPHILGTHGRSGEVIANLQSGSVYFTNFTAWLARAKALVAEYQGRGVECRAVGLTLGANDRSAGTSNATFRAGLVSLQAAYQSAINAALGQSGEVGLMIDQLGAARAASGDGITASAIAQAQLDSALGDAGVYLYLAKYILPYASGVNGNVHFSALGMDLMGEYLGKALYRRRVHSATRFCPMPRLSGISVAGNVVTLPVDLVPVPGVAGSWYGLQFTTALREQATQQGFAATGGVSVTNVVLTANGAGTGTATITVTLSGAPGAGAALEYAYTGTVDHATSACAWGNVADTDPAASVTDPGRVLLNPMPAFRKVIA